MSRFLLSILLLVGGFWTGPAGAEIETGKSSEAPIHITSDRLESRFDEQTVTFIGQVVARQEDVVIYSAKLVLHYGEQGGQIEEAIASGDVRIVQGERVATGQRGVFYNDERKIVLTGSPKVFRGDDVVEGDEVTVFLDEERSIVSSREGSRVNAIFHPREQKP